MGGAIVVEGGHKFNPKTDRAQEMSTEGGKESERVNIIG